MGQVRKNWSLPFSGNKEKNNEKVKIGATWQLMRKNTEGFCLDLFFFFFLILNTFLPYSLPLGLMSDYRHKFVPLDVHSLLSYFKYYSSPRI